MKKFAYDDRLVYDTSISFPDLAEVLDAGTGTGIWLLDLARELPPTATLHGCDLSSNQFPKDDASRSAPDVHFHVAPICDLPEEWTRKFDLVNQRMLMGGLPAKDWPVALEQYLRVLKPGGHIQIAELAPGSIQHQDRPNYRILDENLHKILDKIGLMYDGGDRLAEMLGKAGFVNIRSEKKFGPVGKARGECGVLGEVAIMGAFQTLREGFIKMGVVSNGEEHDELILKVQREYEEKGGFDVAMTLAYAIAIAEKP